MSPDANPFEQMGGADEGAPSLSSRDIAAAAAAEAIRGPATSPPGSMFHDGPLPSEESQYMSFEEPEEAFEEPPDPPAPSAPSTPQWTPEALEQLNQLGVDLPFSPTDIPQGFEGAYAEMAQAILDSRMQAAQATMEAQEAIMRISGFAEKLQTPEGQQRMLLTMALNNPDVFSKVYGEVERMQTDPEYAQVVQRDLEARARLEAAERRERAMMQSQIQQKALQVEARADRVARKFGIDSTWAKEQVAQRILLNEQRTGKRDISFQEVDEVISGLAQRVGKQPPTPKTPQQLAAERRAPQPAAPAPADPTPPAAPRAPQPGQPVGHWSETLKGAVKSAANRTRNQSR